MIILPPAVWLRPALRPHSTDPQRLLNLQPGTYWNMRFSRIEPVLPYDHFSVEISMDNRFLHACLQRFTVSHLEIASFHWRQVSSIKGWSALPTSTALRTSGGPLGSNGPLHTQLLCAVCYSRRPLAPPQTGLQAFCHRKIFPKKIFSKKRWNQTRRMTDNCFENNRMSSILSLCLYNHVWSGNGLAYSRIRYNWFVLCVW